MAVSAPPAKQRLAAGAAVQVEHVWKSYASGSWALVDVTLELDPGELVALTGPSGSGKTTLLNMIGALDRPDRGEIVVDGQPLAALAQPADFRRDTVGFVFQLHDLLPALSVAANVEVAMIPAGVPAAERRLRAPRLLAAVGLAGHEAKRPVKLSGGERQRVAVARALANSPRLLLADEPTGSLDPEAADQVLALLSKLRAETGVTIFAVSYDSALLERADRVLHIRAGALLAGERHHGVEPGGSQRRVETAEHPHRHAH